MNNQASNAAILLPILKQISLFKSLDPQVHNEIVAKITLMFYPQGHQLFAEGDMGDTMYIIRNGQVEIFKNPKEEGELPKSLAVLQSGDFFGEMALVSDAPRNANAKALMDSEIFILKKEDFQMLLASNTDMAQQISQAVVERTNSNDKLSLQ
jgi:CRP-like cAMP-binding protein